jgi:hypothetical protein
VAGVVSGTRSHIASGGYATFSIGNGNRGTGHFTSALTPLKVVFSQIFCRLLIVKMRRRQRDYGKQGACPGRVGDAALAFPTNGRGC